MSEEMTVQAAGKKGAEAAWSRNGDNQAKAMADGRRRAWKVAYERRLRASEVAIRAIMASPQLPGAEEALGFYIAEKQKLTAKLG